MQEKMFSILLLVVLCSLLFGAANTAVFLCEIVLGVLIVLCAAHLMDFIETRGRPGRAPLGGPLQRGASPRESGGLQSEARAVPRTLVPGFKQAVGALVKCGQVFHAYLKLRAGGDEQPEGRRRARDRSPQRGPSPQRAQPSATPAPRARSALQLLEEVVGACVQYAFCARTACARTACARSALANLTTQSQQNVVTHFVMIASLNGKETSDLPAEIHLVPYAVHPYNQGLSRLELARGVVIKHSTKAESGTGPLQCKDNVANSFIIFKRTQSSEVMLMQALFVAREVTRVVVHDFLSSLWLHEIQPIAWELSLMQPIYKGGNRTRPPTEAYT